MYNPIDYLKISHAVLAYQGMGYKLVEVPWIVSRNVAELTTPKHTCNLLVYKDVGPTIADKELTGALVGSAEQGLLHIYDQLTDGQRYVSVSPCFRVEQTHTPGLIQDQFFKVELFVKNPAHPEPTIRELLVHAKMLMGTWERKLLEVPTEEGYDLQINGIEVGSYGVRSVPGTGAWAYGTGIALPRFDYAREQNGKA